MMDYEPTPEVIRWYAERSGKPLTFDECELARAWLLANAAEWQRGQVEPEPDNDGSVIGAAALMIGCGVAWFFLGLLVGAIAWR